MRDNTYNGDGEKITQDNNKIPITSNNLQCQEHKIRTLECGKEAIKWEPPKGNPKIKNTNTNSRPSPLV